MSERKTSFLVLLILLSAIGNHCYDLGGFRGASADSLVDKDPTSPCNGTFGECKFGDDFDGGEFLRHYAAGSRWLLQSGSKLSYKSLQQRQVCSTPKYSNCIVQGGGGRECSDYNRCKRAPG